MEGKKIFIEKSEKKSQEKIFENLDNKHSRKKTESTSSDFSADKSSSDQINSGSEFGDDSITQDMNNKMPIIQTEMADLLKIKNSNILNNKINLFRISEGTVLCKEGDYVFTFIFLSTFNFVLYFMVRIVVLYMS